MNTGNVSNLISGLALVLSATSIGVAYEMGRKSQKISEEALKVSSSGASLERRKLLNEKYHVWSSLNEKLITNRKLNNDRFKNGLILAKEFATQPQTEQELNACRRAGREFLSLLDDDTRVLCKTFLEENGNAQALNVVLATAPMDAANAFRIKKNPRKYPETWDQVVMANVEIGDTPHTRVYKHIFENNHDDVLRWYGEDEVEKLLQVLQKEKVSSLISQKL